MKKGKSQLSEKGFNDFENLKKSSRLKPNSRKNSKNWKNSLFDEEDEIYKYKEEDFDEEE